MRTVAEFLAGDQRNAWIASPGIHAYVRKGHRLADGKPVRSFDIANVEVTARRRGVGVFTSWYETAVAACREAGVEYVYVESIMSEVVEGFCKRRGFTLVSVDNSAPSYIKKI